MPTPTAAPSSTSPRIDVSMLQTQWAAGALAFSRSTMALLDAQTLLWRDAERCMANLMQPWVEAGGPPPSAQALMDAAQNLGLELLAPKAFERACRGWGQVWMNALRHDANEA